MISPILLLDALFLGPLRARRQFYDLVILDSKMNIPKKEEGNLVL